MAYCRQADAVVHDARAGPMVALNHAPRPSTTGLREVETQASIVLMARGSRNNFQSVSAAARNLASNEAGKLDDDSVVGWMDGCRSIVVWYFVSRRSMRAKGLSLLAFSTVSREARSRGNLSCLST